VVALWDSPHQGAVVVNSRTGTVRERYDYLDTDGWAYWLGGEATCCGSDTSGKLVLEGFDCGSAGNGCGSVYAVLDSGVRTIQVDGGTLSVLPEGLLVPNGADDVFFYPSMKPRYFDLRPLPDNAPAAWVTDTMRRRIYVVSSGGMVAQIDRLGRRKPRVSYHPVDLNGHSFEADWAGQGRLALWGEDGLGTIDTRTWTSHAISADVRSALTTSHGIVAWRYGTAGVRVYRQDGSLRFTVLSDKVIPGDTINPWLPPSSGPPIVAGPYLYVWADHRYTIDLRTGRVIGRARPDARIATPSYISIP
jgi:hypothetical protein